MIISELINKYGLIVNGFILVGLKSGDEIDTYLDAGLDKFLILEPSSENFDSVESRCRERPVSVKAYQAAIGSEEKIFTLNEEEVDQRILDEFFATFDNYNFLVIKDSIDAVDVIKGGLDALNVLFNYVYCNGNDDVDKILSEHGYSKVEDNFYIRTVV
tara:strand:- start:753 stop:1229 length:477 start_codon:yes stop_codon:yes gene_type:complete